MLILVLSLLTAPAHAGLFKKKVAASFCTPVTEIGKQIEGCEDNDRYLEHGEKCLDKLDAEAKALAEFLPAGFSPNADARQAGKFDSAGLDYAQMSAALGYLVETAKLAESETLGYRFSLEWPPDIDEQDVTNGDELAYAMSVECYGVNRENLDSLRADFTRRRKNLEDAKAIADSFLAKVNQSKGNLDASSLNAVPAGGEHAQGAGAVKTGSSKKTSSTITGVKRKP